MPKLVCRCGFVHNLSPIPDAGHIVVRDVDYERLIDLEHALASQPADSTAILHTINTLHSRLYECPDCGRLAWLQEDERVLFFRRETP